jgi:hypothetical protein
LCTATHIDAAPITAWTVYGQGYTAETAAEPDIKCVNTDSTQTSGGFETITLNQTTARPILITGWSKAQSVDGVADNDYSIYVDLTYSNGSSLWGQTAPFNTGTHDWQQEKLVIVPTQPVRSINVYALFRNHTGTAWFREYKTGDVDTTNLFDGQAIKAPTLSPTAESGWFVRDVSNNSALLPIAAGRDVLGLRLSNASPLPSQDNKTLTNLTAAPRCLSLYYVQRFSAKDAVWWDDIRTKRTAAPGHEYANLVHVNAGSTGQLSLYPFGCVTSDRAGLAVGIPPSLGPRVDRIAYNPQASLLYAVFDLALAAHGDAARHDSAPAAVVHYPIDPSWGFRDGARLYYADFPDAYKRRALAEGIWMPFTDPAKVSNNGDFHFAYHEGDNDVSGDRLDGDGQRCAAGLHLSRGPDRRRG